MREASLGFDAMFSARNVGISANFGGPEFVRFADTCMDPLICSMSDGQMTTITFIEANEVSRLPCH